MCVFGGGGGGGGNKIKRLYSKSRGHVANDRQIPRCCIVQKAPGVQRIVTLPWGTLVVVLIEMCLS